MKKNNELTVQLNSLQGNPTSLTLRFEIRNPVTIAVMEEGSDTRAFGLSVLKPGDTWDPRKACKLALTSLLRRHPAISKKASALIWEQVLPVLPPEKPVSPEPKTYRYITVPTYMPDTSTWILRSYLKENRHQSANQNPLN